MTSNKPSPAPLEGLDGLDELLSIEEAKPIPTIASIRAASNSPARGSKPGPAAKPLPAGDLDQVEVQKMPLPKRAPDYPPGPQFETRSSLYKGLERTHFAMHPNTIHWVKHWAEAIGVTQGELVEKIIQNYVGSINGQLAPNLRAITGKED